MSTGNEGNLTRRERAARNLAEWQAAYLENPDRRLEFDRASTIPSEHFLKDTQLARAVAAGAQTLGGLCSNSVAMPTSIQNRYEYIILARLVEDLRHASESQQVELPSNILLGSLPTGYPVAQTVQASTDNYDDYLVVFHSGLFGYLYILGRIVASCIPFESKKDGISYSLDINKISEWISSQDRANSRYIGPGDAVGLLQKLLEACLVKGSPWAVPPTRVRLPLIPIAESLVDSSQAFVVAHEIGHLQLGHLEESSINRHSLGPSSEAEFVDYDWRGEMEADFFGLQASLAACAARKNPTIATYAGANLYLNGVDILYQAMEIMSKTSDSGSTATPWPPMRNRRTALSAGFDFYLADTPQVWEREDAFASASGYILEDLWRRCRLSLESTSSDKCLAQIWQPSLKGGARRTRPNCRRAGVEFGARVYELLSSVSSREKALLIDVAPAVAAKLLLDLNSESREIRTKAAQWLEKLDPAFSTHVAKIRFQLAGRQLDERLGDDPNISGIVAYTSSCIRNHGRRP